MREHSRRWYEPQHQLLPEHYYVYAWGSIYAMASRTARMVLQSSELVPLRYMGNEGELTTGSALRSLELSSIVLYSSMHPSLSTPNPCLVLPGDSTVVG